MKDSLPEPGSFEALLPSSHHTVSIARPFDKCPHTHTSFFTSPDAHMGAGAVSRTARHQFQQ